MIYTVNLFDSSRRLEKRGYYRLVWIKTLQNFYNIEKRSVQGCAPLFLLLFRLAKEKVSLKKSFYLLRPFN